MNQRPFEIPTWAPVVAVAAFLVWAVSIWWMVASLDAGGDSAPLEEGVNALHDDVGTLAGRIEALSTQVDGLTDERDVLLARVDDLEASRALVAATPEATPAAETSRLFTDGKDRYNCRSFASYEEAQEALRVNGPGDPNHIDTNKNGLACEDVKFKATPTPTATPTPADTAAMRGITAR